MRLPLVRLDTNYWGIELRCVQSVCTWPGKIQLSQITVSATEAQGPSITPVADPGSLWGQAGTGSGTRRVMRGPSPWPQPIRRASAA